MSSAFWQNPATSLRMTQSAVMKRKRRVFWTNQGIWKQMYPLLVCGSMEWPAVLNHVPDHARSREGWAINTSHVSTVDQGPCGRSAHLGWLIKWPERRLQRNSSGSAVGQKEMLVGRKCLGCAENNATMMLVRAVLVGADTLPKRWPALSDFLASIGVINEPRRAPGRGSMES